MNAKLDCHGLRPRNDEAAQAGLFPETLLVSNEGGRIFTTSLKVAGHFHKAHRNVVRSIERLLEELPVEAFNVLNFERVEYKDKKGEMRLMFQINHDAFAVLAMGFTGKEALAWKLDFLNAFRQMERELAALKEREAAALYAIRPRWQPIVAHPDYKRAALIELTGHKSPASITACRRRMRQVGLLTA
ncbi:MAG: Rha family transcriptional regulator [Zoogloeaceae bacterium]|jgi:Rha family phage regulatory protein|nr:Rha family transcriptional regulator [Zoogloeaceae bacterium]